MNQDIHKANFWNFWKNSNFLLFIDIKWLEVIVRNKKWSLLMILTTKKAAHIAKFAELVWFVWLCSNVQTVLRWATQKKHKYFSTFWSHHLLIRLHAKMRKDLSFSNWVKSISSCKLVIATVVARRTQWVEIVSEEVFLFFWKIFQMSQSVLKCFKMFQNIS